MALTRTYFLTVNPEQWTIGPVSSIRRNGKSIPFVAPNEQLLAYQKAVQEEIRSNSSGPIICSKEPCEVRFYFWRRLDKYILPSERAHSRHVADATNLQKGLEDALQGLLFTNDRQVQYISSEIVEQTTETQPGIIIVIRTPYTRHYVPDLDVSVLQEFNSIRKSSDRLNLDNAL